MPNWCDGSIRVRGTYTQIVRFFSENLVALKGSGPPKFELEDLPVKVYHDGDYYTRLEKPDKDCLDEFWFKDSRRQFMNTKCVEIVDTGDGELEPITCCIDGFRGAWCIDLDYYGPLAVKYGVDIKLVGFDKGCEFMEIAEFYRDGTASEKIERFSDWDWECIRPNLGG